MSWLKDRSEKRRAEAEASEVERQAAEAAAALEQRRQQQLATAAQALELRELVETAKTFRGDSPADLDERPPIVVKKGEAIYGVLRGVVLVEPRSAGGTYKAGSQGISIHVPGTRSMRYRVGRTQGRYVPNQLEQTAIDTGTAVITDQRVVFTGSKANREWSWSKCLAVDHDDDRPFSAIAVSNRQKTSGIAYTDETARDIRFRLDLALAVATGTTDELIRELEEDLNLLEATLGIPTTPLPHGSALPPPAPL